MVTTAVVAVVARPVVVDVVLGAIVVAGATTVVVVGVTATGGVLHPRIVVPTHCPVSKLLSRPHSL